MSQQKKIIIKGAREHNLKNINIDIPRDKLVVITGLSGSGKSSLAFDTIYAEGQRRYVESLSSYARQFLGQMEKPDVDLIEGLSPAISIDQKGGSKNPRSTVGTITEVYDYLRLLWARVGVAHCPICQRVITTQTTEEIVDQILTQFKNEKILVMAPMVIGKKGEHQNILNNAKKSGFVRVKIDGTIYELSDTPALDKNKKHYIDIVVDRLVLKDDDISRIRGSCEQASRLSGGIIKIGFYDENKNDILLSQNFAWPYDGFSMETPNPRNFSFNNPHGACERCTGLGTLLEIDEKSVVLDEKLPILKGALYRWSSPMSGDWNNQVLKEIAQLNNIDLQKPWKELSDKEKQIILYGIKNRIPVPFIDSHNTTRTFNARFLGVIPSLQARYQKTDSQNVKEELEKLMMQQPCPVCKGQRLKAEFLNVLVNNMGIMQFSALSVDKSLAVLNSWTFNDKDQVISREIIKEIKERLMFLTDVGLQYLTLNRSAASLSGGEAQRIRLASQIGSKLTGVLYVLDEPSIGLHQSDNQKLLDTLTKLRDLGNSVLVVEHDEETIRHADHIIDVGPLAGIDGGQIMAQGKVEDIIKNKKSLTGQYLSQQLIIPVPEKRRTANNHLAINGAVANNLKNITVPIPLGCFVGVCGVSGSGKSTLINDILYRHLAQVFYHAKEKPLSHESITGLEYIDKVVAVDQSPIGRTPRSNPATYTGAFSFIRELFSKLPQSKTRGYGPGRFSFNVTGGRCETCEGAGVIKIEMHFLPDIYVTCDTCNGRRYTNEVLDIKFKNYNIADILAMPVDQAYTLLQNQPSIAKKLKTLIDVGLGYIHMGQAATLLSGGEAQRIKLASELSKRGTGQTVYILDEPTTGLHFADVHKLIEVLQQLVNQGNTVIVIEHNLDVLKSCDWLLDLGPKGGDEGGYLLAQGTPETIAQNKSSATGAYLLPLLHINNEEQN